MPYSNTHGKCVNLYRKEVFQSCSGYDEVMTSYEDWDLLLTLYDHGIEGDVLPDEMFEYRRHFDSMVYNTANRQRADLIQYMMIKHEKALAPYAPLLSRASLASCAALRPPRERYSCGSSRCLLCSCGCVYDPRSTGSHDTCTVLYRSVRSIFKRQRS